MKCFSPQIQPVSLHVLWQHEWGETAWGSQQRQHGWTLMLSVSCCCTQILGWLQVPSQWHHCIPQPWEIIVIFNCFLTLNTHVIIYCNTSKLQVNFQILYCTVFNMFEQFTKLGANKRIHCWYRCETKVYTSTNRSTHEMGSFHIICQAVLLCTSGLGRGHGILFNSLKSPSSLGIPPWMQNICGKTTTVISYLHFLLFLQVKI